MAWKGQGFNDSMKVSIVITTMNRADILTQRSLRSALGQEFNDFEVIVVDGGQDDTRKRVMQTKATYVWTPPIGLSNARNVGIKMSQGDYVVCLDDDNELLPQFLKKTVEKLDLYKDNPTIMAVRVGKLIKYVEKNFEDYAPAGDSKFQSIDWGWLIKREVFDVIQYDEAAQANEDMDFGIQYFKRYDAVSISEPLAIAFDIEGDPKKSLSFPSERELGGMDYFLKKNLKEYTDPNELRYLYRLAGRKYYRGGYKLKGLKYFWKSFWAAKRLEPLAHLMFILMGWTIYDKFMEIEERIGAAKRRI